MTLPTHSLDHHIVVGEASVRAREEAPSPVPESKAGQRLRQLRQIAATRRNRLVYFELRNKHMSSS
jgi:hypothetical protein